MPNVVNPNGGHVVSSHLNHVLFFFLEIVKIELMKILQC
jgi:hypothetical protein